MTTQSQARRAQGDELEKLTEGVEKPPDTDTEVADEPHADMSEEEEGLTSREPSVLLHQSLDGSAGILVHTGPFLPGCQDSGLVPMSGPVGLSC